LFHVPGRDVLPWQGRELAEQAGLVALDGDQVVRTPVAEVFRVLALGCSASAVTSTSSRSPAWPSRAVNMVISLVLPSTAAWAITTPEPWSRQASRCGAAPSAARAPRTVLPSTASTTRPAARRRGARREATHEPIARSSAAGSTEVSTRQIVTRSGTAPGSPGPARSRGGASAAHSAIAAYDRAPASIAHTAMAKTGTSG
jgi:hypothetical protein